MSNALAISAVTAVLQYWLTQVFGSSTALNGVIVSAKAPDLVQAEIAAAGTQMRLNLFLHQVTHNAALRNLGLPSLAADGATQLSNPPLALDLHYLMTAYGTEDWEAEALLGTAILMLHDNPVLARSDIATALENLPSLSPAHALSVPLAIVLKGAPYGDFQVAMARLSSVFGATDPTRRTVESGSAASRSGSK